MTAINILAVMVALTNGLREDPAAREARLWPIAVELDRLSDSPREVSFALAQWRKESSGAASIQYGQCRPGQCDPSKGKAQAHGPWQAHEVKSNPEWSELWVRARTDGAAAAKLQIEMQRKAFSCGGNMVHAFSAHDGAGCRDTERGMAREKLRRGIYSRLMREIARSK
jgi:hypothetical protein